MATQTRAEAKLSRSRSVAALRVREHTEEVEKANLAECATRSADAHRDRPEDPSPTRAAFALDRDRIVDRIEKNGAGLNITKEVRDGIQKHSAPTEGGVETVAWGTPETPEGWVVRYADKIAYLHHDIDDAMRAEIVREEDIPQDIRASLGRDRAERLDTMIYDVIVTSYGKPEVTMSDEVLEATNALRKFMFENVYLAGPAKTEDRKAQGVLWELLQHFEKHPELLPPEHQRIAQRDGVKRAVADYVAGMTDRHALDTYASIFIPSGWSHL